MFSTSNTLRKNLLRYSTYVWDNGITTVGYNSICSTEALTTHLLLVLPMLLGHSRGAEDIASLASSVPPPMQILDEGRGGGVTSPTTVG